MVRHLEKIGPASTRQFIVLYNMMRPAAVVKSLREKGVPIETTIVWKKRDDGSTTHYALYSLRKDETESWKQ
jgi:hypothetical protein